MGNPQAWKAAVMTKTVDIVAVEVPQGFSYEHLQDQRLRDWAMAAAGTIRSNISGAVQKVLEAGHLLQQAKDRLPHGAYIPWVEQACHLKPNHASQLIKAAAWVNEQHVDHLGGVTDTATLFLLSADATPEDVREWFMERCAAGDVPTRAEVVERKRTAGRPRQPQPAEGMALSILRKGDLDRIREALQLAESASAVTAAEVMDEQRLRDLGKLRFIPGAAADFHRMKDGSWIRLPHAGDADVTAEPPAPVAHEAQQSLLVMKSPSPAAADVVSLGEAAKRIGVKRLTLTAQLAPSRNPNGITKSGFLITRESWGMVRLTPVAEPT
jgi:hypothetical protein